MRERHNALETRSHAAQRPLVQFWWNRFSVSTALGAAKD